MVSLKDCILLCIERKDKVQKEWEYLFTLNELDFKGALDTWFEYYYGQTSLYVICNNEIVEQFSFKDKKKCDAAFSKGLPVVDDTCKGIKISSHTELMSYMYDMSGVSIFVSKSTFKSYKGLF